MTHYERAARYALDRLESELSPHLSYHNTAHTQIDVLGAVERFATLEGVADGELMLVKTAAWYHDLGYIEQAVEHQMVSARIAEEVLPIFGYSSADVAAIRGMIIATRLPQTPQTPLERILADADLDTLGQPDFAQKCMALRRELAVLGQRYSDKIWFASQFKFMEAHHYFTASALRVNADGKARNLAWLTAALEQALE